MPFGTWTYKFIEETQTSVQLQPVIGGHELVFAFSGSVQPQGQREVAAWLVVHGGRVAVQTSLGKKMLGTARPTCPTRITQGINPGRFAFELKLHLNAAQLSALEDHRNGERLEFGISLAGISGPQPNGNSGPQEVNVPVAQSAWIEQLNTSGAMNVLLLEVASPMTGAAPGRKAVFDHLQRAKRHFANGLYSECVTECRKAVEELESGLDPVPWAKLASNDQRENLIKGERIRCLLGTMRLYAHPSAHSESRGGTSDYSRADAKLALALIAATVMHEQAA